jgi:enediyne polyketide synthase
LDAYHDPDARTPDKTYGRNASLIDGFQFDWVGRRIPRRTFEGTDISHWLALEVALQALCDSGYGRDTLPRERTGVIVGNTLTGEQSRSLSLRVRWPFVERAIRAAARSEGIGAKATDDLVGSTQSYFKSVFPPVDEDTLAGSLSNTIAGRICNFLDLKGGGYTVDGACASSLLAVANAANALCNKDLDVALVGGVDVSLDPFELVGFAKVGALSPTQMRVYDRAANGFTPGEGCGFVVLKRLCDARADGDYVYATVRGWGLSSDGAGGITAPSTTGQALAIRRAYKRAGYSPELLHFVEGHGTGTPAGDPVELKAISSAMQSYGAGRPRSCGVTSFKSIVGHTKAAAGIGGFIKATIAANRRVIPPTSGCLDPNPIFNEEARVLYPIQEGSVESPDAVLRAGVSAMGFGGINAHVTLESADPPASRLKPSLDEEVLLASPQSTELFLMSAHSIESLRECVERVASRADGSSMAELADLAAELAAEIKPDCGVRCAIVASEPDELEAHLRDVLETLRNDPPAPGATRRCPDARNRVWIANTPPRARLGFLFPGQGSQQLGMARHLARRFDWAKRFVERADRWLTDLGHEPITPFIFRPLDRAFDDEQVRDWRQALRQTQHAQPAICLSSVLWLKYLARLGVSPTVVGGHSLGELSAFHAAGAFDERSLIQLAATRGRLMAAADASGTMANLSCTRDEAEGLIAEAAGYCAVANLNAPAQTVVSGDRDVVERIVRIAKARSIPAVPLNVSGAFHSAHFRETADALRESDGVPDICDPLHTPMLSAIDGAEIRTGVSIRDYLSRQMCAEVDFVTVVRSMADRCDLLLEVGPGSALSGLVKRTVGPERLPCFAVESRPGKDEDLNVAVAALFAHGHRLRLDALYDSRLCRPFVPASEKQFIENPCERPFPDEVFPVLATSSDETAGRALTVIPPPLQSGDASSEPPRRQVVESQIVQKPTVQDAVLCAVEAQTGFPVESLTLDLRLVDDLHLDSIKTVELVSDVADQLGITEAFDAAQFGEATLGELVERMELLEASAEPAATAAEHKSQRPWVGNFALEWDDEPLASSTEGGGLLTGRTLVLTPDPEDGFVTTLLGELVASGVEVVPTDGSSEETPFDHLLVVCPDTTAPSDVEELGDVVEMLTRAVRLLPPTDATRDRISCVAWVRTRTSESGPKRHYDWSADAFAATVHLERRQLRVRSLEFASAARQPARIADAVIRELADDQSFASARYDADGHRLVGRPRLQERASYASRAASIGADDIVLVTGGAKGITAQCALALGRETRATLILVGSTPVPDADDQSSGANEIRETLARFRDEGLRCEYRRCNLAVRQDVERLVASVRSDYGSVDVVIHGAGLNHPRRVEESDVSEVLSELAPKVVGAVHLFDALDAAPPKIFVALTSIIGVVGMPHNAWYAFANQSLERSLGRFAARHPSVETASLAYSIWDEVGMGAKLGSIERLGKLGIEAIPVEEGAARFVEVVTRDPGSREVMITGRLGGVDTWKPVLPELPRASRFVDQILMLEPGRELVCRTKLDLTRDSYVRDHVYEGSHLLPAVFGLEAMAQAVAYVTGQSELRFPLLIEDVELTRPLVVHPDRGLTIEIHARVEDHDIDDAQRVRAEIRSHQTGFEHPHFSAVFVLGAATPRREQTSEVPTTALPLRPQEHLYGSVLFQGPRFQRIDELHDLDAKRCTFTARQGLSRETWLLGDPYFRDALLQSLQLCVVPDQCVPVSVHRWEIAGPDPSLPVKRLGRAVIEGQEGDTYIGSVSSMSSGGAPIEVLEGYRARTLSTRADWPGAEEVARRGSTSITELSTVVGPSDARTRVNAPQPWDGSVFYRDVPGYGHEGQTAFFCRFPLSAQDSSSVSGALNFASYFRWAGKLREWGGMNTPGVYQGILEMLGSNEVMSATNECETRIFKVPQRNDLIEGRYWMEYVNKGDAGNIFEWWRIPFPTGEPELIAWTRMRISAVKAIRHGVIAATDWPDFLYRFLKDMGDDAPEPSKGPKLDLDLGAPLFSKVPGPQPGVLLAEQTFSTSQEDSNVVGNIYFANYSVWQGRVTDRFFQSIAPHTFENRGTHGELHRAETAISQLRDAMPFDEISVVMRLDKLYDRGAHLSFDFFRKEPEGVTKIAAGRNLVTWARVERGAEPRVINWPADLKEAMLACVDERARTFQKYA